MAEGDDTSGQGPGYSRPFSVIQPSPYAHERNMAAHRLSDSRFFFSERRLSQLFNVDAWTEENDESRNDFGDDDDPGHEPPPEPAPRASYCPPSPGTPGDPGPQPPDSHYPPGLRESALYSTLSSGCHLDPRFSAEVALDMARLSTISGGSARFSSGRLDDEDEDEDTYGGGNNGDVTPTPGSPGSCRSSRKLSSRYSQMSTLADSLASSGPRSSLPSVLSDLAGEVDGVADLLTDDDEALGPGPRVWGGEEVVNWQERCLELELSLQRFRDQAGKIRELLREKHIRGKLLKTVHVRAPSVSGSGPRCIFIVFLKSSYPPPLLLTSMV
ncbi:uncharacterized protein LOC135100934 [Scylla paramamosain]|uniref:uncharacterized protein LOC135100934 n=1 Tax=Scylla paramamosain TaxID=85552 RepID=UPI00308322C7